MIFKRVSGQYLVLPRIGSMFNGIWGCGVLRVAIIGGYFE